MESEEKPAIENVSIESAEAAVQDLYDFRDHYFEHNGINKAPFRKREITNKLKETLATLDYIQASSENTSRCLYLRGKALNVKSEYDSMAEDALTKAVKLEPKLVEAWNCLGECYWKKGNVAAARNCFVGALSHSKNKASLRNLSMVLRQIGSDSKERADNVRLSVEKAKEAVSLDITDGMSWYVLGNAYLSLFFSGSQSPQILKQCMSAYGQAEKDLVAANNPDLHFNRAMAYKYQEEFKQSVENFRQAHKLDPGWVEAEELCQRVLNYLTDTIQLAQGKGKLKTKRLQSMVNSLGEAELGPYSGGSYTSAAGKTVDLDYTTLDKLTPEINAGKVVVGRMVGSVQMDDPLPYTCAIVDKSDLCLPVTVYNMASGAGFVVGDAIAIPEPYVQVTDFTEDGKVFQFKSIRVDNPVVLAVNKKKLGASHLAPSVLSVTAISE
ncbi:predicted protein [Nematostella vectensis]|uniref:Tetratricopeptide repeat protein 5 OB fold domain-containing protein n=2 Tax=Nematostella vectensis TaxID=45351 RepID=A7RRB4_NEMVE|nr:predicted protein [Nematostella vectensis]|eukprot:XP_001638044.1 predicted protein [Nematostella vectensis]